MSSTATRVTGLHSVLALFSIEKRWIYGGRQFELGFTFSEERSLGGGARSFGGPLGRGGSLEAKKSGSQEFRSSRTPEPVELGEPQAALEGSGARSRATDAARLKTVFSGSVIRLRRSPEVHLAKVKGPRHD